MRFSSSLSFGGLALAGMLFLPASASLAAPAQSGNELQAENTFTQSLKETYNDAKNDLKKVVNNITADGKSDEQKYREEREKQVKEYHEKVRDARQDYAEKRMNAQKAYLKDHGQLPIKEDIEKDLNTVPVK